MQFTWIFSLKCRLYLSGKQLHEILSPDNEKRNWLETFDERRAFYFGTLKMKRAVAEGSRLTWMIRGSVICSVVCTGNAAFAVAVNVLHALQDEITSWDRCVLLSSAVGVIGLRSRLAAVLPPIARVCYPVNSPAGQLNRMDFR